MGKENWKNIKHAYYSVVSIFLKCPLEDIVNSSYVLKWRWLIFADTVSVFYNTRGRKARKEKAKGRQSRHGNNAKCTLGWPIRLLWVGYQLVPKLSRSQNEKETMSLTQFPVSMR